MFRHQKKVRQTPPASPKETPQLSTLNARFLGKATIHFSWVIAMLMWRIPTSPGRRRLGPGFWIWIFSWKLGGIFVKNWNNTRHIA